MKVRKGFVSNSSSSSFIVAFPKDFDQTADSIKKLLFDGVDVVAIYDDSLSTDTAASIIAKDLEGQMPNDKAKIMNALSHGHLSGSPSFDDFKLSDGNIDWEAYSQAGKKYVEAYLQRILAETEDSNLFIFEYADDTSTGTVMEHGGVFNSVPHVCVSNH